MSIIQRQDMILGISRRAIKGSKQGGDGVEL
jgi:hypothetical protein